MSHLSLPIDGYLPAIVAAVRQGGALVLRAETGAGKTTRVPPALLDAGLAGAGRVLLVEPRRLAARAAAERIAAERGGRVGDEVGFRVRFESRESRATRLLALTDGMLLAALQDDPLLEGVGVVVFDEAHERTLAADLGLAMVARVREAREDLLVVVMSATLSGEPFVSYLAASYLEVPGRSFPVTTSYLERPDERPIGVRVAAGIRRALDHNDGDVLAFLPGRGEIEATVQALEGPPREGLREVDLRRLHGELALDEQRAALSLGPRRRVVLATNVAETSVTVEGITTVVDSGLVRQARHDPARDLPRLDLVAASQAALTQRAGRAGRERPGRCLALFTRADAVARPAAEPPEVARVDPAAAILGLLAWGEPNARSFPWLEAPPRALLEQALDNLERLGAVRRGRLTDLGRLLARLPLAPRLGVLTITGWRLGYGREACRVAALLEGRDVVPPGASPRRARSDFDERLELLDRSQRGGTVRASADQLERVLTRALGPEPHPLTDREEGLARALVAAWPERVGRRRGPRSYRLASGRGAQLASSSALGDPELLVAVDLVDRGTEASIRLAATLEPEWLPADEIVVQELFELDQDSGRVTGRRVRRWGEAVLAEVEIPVPAEKSAAALVAAVVTRPQLAIPGDGSSFHTLRVRLAALAAVRPELAVPSVGPELVTELAGLLAEGRRTLDDLRRAPWTETLLGLLPREVRLALDRDTPESITVPSGRRLPIAWSFENPPVLAVRIQELFGQATTPVLGDGRIPLVLHLLAPSGRPQQVTRDLASFWREGYPAVRKELRARYAKHPWPEDPLAAPPTARAKPRGT